jgi:hypothetical protein
MIEAELYFKVEVDTKESKIVIALESGRGCAVFKMAGCIDTRLYVGDSFILEFKKPN